MGYLALLFLCASIEDGRHIKAGNSNGHLNTVGSNIIPLLPTKGKCDG
jgi:hypothetical protein